MAKQRRDTPPLALRLGGLVPALRRDPNQLDQAEHHYGNLNTHTSRAMR
jgi:hypothetical protein